MDAFLLIPPQVYLGFLFATVTTFVFHALFGRSNRSGLFYWPFGLIFFAGGALAATPLGATYLMIGGLPVLAGIVASIAGLILAHLLLT